MSSPKSGRTGTPGPLAQELTRQVLQRVQSEVAILFGSRARGITGRTRTLT